MDNSVSVSGVINSAGDTDVFEIAVTPGRTYQITTTGLTSSLADGLRIVTNRDVPERNSVETLFNQVATENTAAGQLIATFTAEPGVRYFAEVASSFGSAISPIDYSLEIAEYVDDAADNPTTTASMTFGETFAGQQEVTGDRDWIRLDVDVGQSYLLSSNLSNADFLFLVGIDDQTGERVNTPIVGIGSILNRDPQIGFSPETGVSYFAVVVDRDGTSFGSVTDYALTLGLLPGDTANNTTTTLNVAEGETLQATTQTVGDYDWIKLEVDPGTTYTVTFATPGSFSGFDGFTIYRLDAATGEVLDTLEAVGTVESFSAEAGFDYFVEPAPGTRLAAGGLYTVTLAEQSDDFADNQSTTGVLREDETISITRDFANDIDFVRLDLEAGQSYRISGDERFTIVREDLGDSTFSQINELLGAPNFPDPRVDFSAPTFENSSVNVARFNPEAGFEYYLVTRVNFGTEEFTATRVAAETPDNASSTSFIAPNTTVLGVLEERSDQDWVRLDIPAGESFELQVRGGTQLVIFAVQADGTVEQLDSRLAQIDGQTQQTVVTGRSDATLFAQLGAIEGEAVFGSNSPTYTLDLLPIEDDHSDQRGGAAVLGDIPNLNLTGTAAADVVIGGLGADTIRAFSGNDTLIGGRGRDQLFGGSGVDTASYTDADEDVAVNLRQRIGFRGEARLDRLDSIEDLVGSRFDDLLIGDNANNGISGGDGDDLIFGLLGNDVLSGDAGDDTVAGSFGNDVLSGGDGDDQLSGGNDNDQLFGGTGNDFLNGNNADDRLEGGAGDDDLFGAGGVDLIFGGDGNDTVNGGNTADTVVGGSGNDLVLGGGGSDLLFGSAGADTIRASLGQDTLFGGGGHDNLNGATGNDTLFGESGNDILIGFDGNDTLMGGIGNDTLVGGQGSDRFAFSEAQFGGDVILDFAEADTIDLSALNIGFEDLTLSSQGASTLITLTNGTILLTGVDRATVNTNDFDF